MRKSQKLALIRNGGVFRIVEEILRVNRRVLCTTANFSVRKEKYQDTLFVILKYECAFKEHF